MLKLILLPNILHEDSTWSYTPPHLDALIAESEKGGYQFLKRFHLPKCPIYLLNEHTKTVLPLLEIRESVVGLISDAGLPCLADPGAQLVAAARRLGITIEAIPGPSSIVMALQLSGFSAQQFFFHGYLPREQKELMGIIKMLTPDCTHIFIETPYRTEKQLSLLLVVLPLKAYLCIAFELMSPHAFIRTATVQEWKNQPLPSSKGRAVFLIRL